MSRYALVIGIGEYKNLNPLPQTINDAEAVATLLEQHGDFQVQKLIQSSRRNITKTKLWEELKKLVLNKAERGEALIYFSGHGFTVYEDPSLIDRHSLKWQKGYLATFDCEIEIENGKIVSQKYAISLDNLNDLIQESQLSKLVIILDCCYSGYILKKELITSTLTSLSSPKNYYLMAACREFEEARIIKNEKYSIFTGAMIKGLEPENANKANGQISCDSLFDYIINEFKVKRYLQEPIRMGYGSSIILVTYGLELNSTPKEIPFNQENPYRGLYAFEAEQADYFKGRDQAVQELLSRLDKSRFLAVIGSSGSGKSSLVKAGLLPQLTSDRIPGSSKWEIVSFTPGEHPLDKLTDALTRQQDKSQLLFIDQFEEIFTLCQNEEERKSFIRLVAQKVNTTERQTRIIITIRGDFLNRCADYLEIANLINSVPPTSFIVTPMSSTELEEAIEKPAQLHGVNFERGLISKIASDVINRPGALPILQYALKELWRVCIEEPETSEPILTHKGYAEIDGVRGALDRRATIIYQSLSELDQEFSRRLFMELLQLSGTGEVTRRRADWKRLAAIADSPQQLQRVIELLAGSQQRLIITDEDTIEVAHEALLTEWRFLNNWIVENQENIRLSRSLEEDCQEWNERFNQSDDALLTGAKLAVIAEWINKTQPRLTLLEADFVQKSLNRRNQEIQAQLEQERQLRELAEARQKEAEARAIAEIEKTIAAEDKAKAEAARAKEAEASAKYQKERTRLAIALGTLVAVLGGLVQLNISQQKQKDALAFGALVGQSEIWLNTGNQLEAMITSVQALKQFQDAKRDNPDGFNRLKKVIESVREKNRLEGHQKEVFGVSFSPEGNTIASGGVDKEIIIWNLNWNLKKKHFYRFNSGHTGDIWAVKFSRNNPQLLASTSKDGTINLWNIQVQDEKANLIKTLSHSQNRNDTVYDVSFSADDSMIASSGKDGTIKLWDINGNGNQPKKIFNAKEFCSQCNEYRIYSLDFIDNSTIAYGGNDKKVRIWNIQITNKNNPPKIITESKDIIGMVRFSPIEKLLAIATYGGEIQLWKQENSQWNSIGKFTDHLNQIFGLDFSRDGKLLASGSMDETVKIWQVEEIKKAGEKTRKNLNNPVNPTPFAELKGHTKTINRLEFSPDGNFIASSSDDNTVRLWSVQSNSITNKNSDVDSLLKDSCAFLNDYLEAKQNIPEWFPSKPKQCPN